MSTDVNAVCEAEAAGGSEVGAGEAAAMTRLPGAPGELQTNADDFKKHGEFQSSCFTLRFPDGRGTRRSLTSKYESTCAPHLELNPARRFRKSGGLLSVHLSMGECVEI